MFIHLLRLSLALFTFWCAGSVRIFSGGPGHIYSVCVTSLCGVPGRHNVIRALSWSGWRDCTDFSVSLACCSGYGTVELVKGGSVFFSLSSVLLSVLLAVGCLW